MECSVTGECLKWNKPINQDGASMWWLCSTSRCCQLLNCHYAASWLRQGPSQNRLAADVGILIVCCHIRLMLNCLTSALTQLERTILLSYDSPAPNLSPLQKGEKLIWILISLLSSFSNSDKGIKGKRKFLKVFLKDQSPTKCVISMSGILSSH